MQVDGTTYYYITNLQGDIMGMVDTNGNTVASYTYDPYGKVLTATGTLAEKNPLRYRGYYYDKESGLYYLLSRYYDPATRRFVNTHDIALQVGDVIIGGPIDLHGIGLAGVIIEEVMGLGGPVGRDLLIATALPAWPAERQRAFE